MEITQKKDIIIFSLVIILACLIGYRVIYKNSLNKIGLIKSQIEEEKKKNDILEIIAILDKRLKAYQKRSFSTLEVTQLLDRISQIAKEVGIEVEGFNPLPIMSKKHYAEIPLKVPLSCQYHQLGQFLSRVENSEEFIWVKQLQIHQSATPNPEEENLPKIDLLVSGLYLKK